MDIQPGELRTRSIFDKMCATDPTSDPPAPDLPRGLRDKVYLELAGQLIHRSRLVVEGPSLCRYGPDPRQMPNSEWFINTIDTPWRDSLLANMLMSDQAFNDFVELYTRRLTLTLP